MTKFFQLLAAGTALGAVYALVALGFTVIYRSTGIINFAQPGLVILGAFLVYNGTFTWDLGFWVAALVAAAMVAVIGVLFQTIVLNRMIGRPIYAVILITVGLFLLIEPLIGTIWKSPELAIRSPWGESTISVGDVFIREVDIATIILMAVLVTAFFVLFRYTKIGLAMRATAVDQEAAQAQGIPVRRVYALSWAIAGVVAVAAGMMLGSNAGPATGLSATIALVALRAFPAAILGGLDSPGGAVVGGLAIGITETLTAGYQPENAPWLGDSFASVMPYVVLVVVLLIRPYGLFGTPEVRRV